MSSERTTMTEAPTSRAPAGPARQVPSFLHSYWCLVRWDWVREMKRKDTLISMVLFSLVTLMILAFAIDPKSVAAAKGGAGILWVTLFLASTIGIDRAFRGDDNSAIQQGILLAPVSRLAFFYARLTGTFLYVAMMAVIVFLAFCWLFNVSVSLTQGGQIVGLILATVLGVVALGTPISAMTRSIHGGEVLLRILMLPLLFPLFRGAVTATDQLLHGQPVATQALLMVAVFDVTYICAGQLLIEHVLADFDG